MQKYYTNLIDYVENILRIGHGSLTKYNNLDETDYIRLRKIKHFVRRNLGVTGITATISNGLVGLLPSFPLLEVEHSLPAMLEKTFDIAKKIGAILE